MTRRPIPYVIAAGAFGALLMSAGMGNAATPAPAPGIVQPAAPVLHARMMKRSMVRRDRGRTISTKLGTRTR